MRMLKLDCGLDRDGVPLVSAKRLERYAADILKDYQPELLTSPQPLNIELFAEQYLDACLELRPLTANRSILGVTVFNGGLIPVYDNIKGKLVAIEVPERTIMVEQGIINTHEPGRFNFTLAHEAAGHLACHADVNISTGKICRQERGAVVFMCRPEGATHASNKLKTPEDWLEWQADYMAGAILMPAATVPMAVSWILREAGVLGGDYGLRELRNNPRLQMYVAKHIGQIYRTSTSAARIRLQNLDLIGFQA